MQRKAGSLKFGQQRRSLIDSKAAYRQKVEQ
jgi:hypothetical protein